MYSAFVTALRHPDINLEIIKALVESGFADVNEKWQDWTPTEWIISRIHGGILKQTINSKNFLTHPLYQVLKYLLEKGSDPNLPSSISKYKALQTLYYHFLPENYDANLQNATDVLMIIANMLLEHGADPNVAVSLEDYDEAKSKNTIVDINDYKKLHTWLPKENEGLNDSFFKLMIEAALKKRGDTLPK